jgi:hypothetical protein
MAGVTGSIPVVPTICNRERGGMTEQDRDIMLECVVAAILTAQTLEPKAHGERVVVEKYRKVLHQLRDRGGAINPQPMA